MSVRIQVSSAPACKRVMLQGLFFVLVFSALAACSGEVTSEQYLDRARGYLAESDLAAASIELQNSLQKNPQQAEARWMLGNVSFHSGDMPAAEHEFLKAQELGWSDDDILPALCKTYLAMGDIEAARALEHEGLSAAGAAVLLSHQATAALAAGEPDNAQELIELAASKDPESVEVKLARATLLINEDDAEGALRAVNAAIKAAPENDRAWRLKGQALMRLERLEEARDALDQSIEFSYAAFSDRVARALINIQFEEFEAAQEDATVLMEMGPAHPAANYVQGLLHYQNKDYLMAIETLNQAVPVAEQYPLVTYYLAVAYQFEQDVDLSANFAGRFVALQPESGTGRKLRAITLMQTDKPAQANAVLRPVLNQTPGDIETLNILGNALLLSDQAYGGLVLYQQIKALDPDWEIIPLRHEGKIITGGSGEVIKRAPESESGKDNNFPQTDILKILEHLEAEDYPAAIDAAKSYQFRDLESLSPYHVLAKIYLAAGQTEEAKAAFEKALKRDPGDPFSNLNLAKLNLDMDDPDAARAHYTTILEHDSGNLGALLQLAALEAQQGNAPGVLRWLNQAITAHPKALEPRLNLARFYLATGQSASVGPLFSQVDESQRNSPAVLELYGMALISQQKFDEAIVEYEQLVAQQPDSARNHYLLAIATSGVGDNERSKAALHKAIELEEDHVPSLLSLAKIAISEGDQETFDVYMVKLVDIAPDELDVIRLQAAGAKGAGDNEAALKHFNRAFELSPSTQTAVDLAIYQWGAGMPEEGRAGLEAWISKNPEDVGARMALAGQLQGGQDIAAAIKHYQAVLEIQPGNPVALNNLAWSLKDSKPRRALEHINRAARMVPDNPSILDTQAVIKHINGDYAGAQESVQRALAGAPDQPSILYHAAMIHAALGEADAAIVILKTITAEAAPDFPERSEAVALLNDISG